MATATRKKTVTKKASAKKTPAKKTPAKKASVPTLKNLPKQFFIKDGKGYKETTIGGFKRKCKEDLRLRAEEVDEFMKSIDAGEDLELSPDLPEEKVEFYTNAYSTVQEWIEESQEYAQEIEQEQKELEIEKAKEKGTLALAGVAGREVGQAMVDDFQVVLQQVAGDNFEVGATFLHVKEGAIISEEEVGNLMGRLVGGDQALDRMRGSVLWQLGDLLVLAEESFPNFEDLIATVADVMGKDKHTIREARRLAKGWPEEDRMEGLTATHHQEILNYRDKIKPKSKLKKILAEVIKGVETTVMTTDPETGEAREITENKPLSCGKMRKMLQEAAGVEPTGKDGADTGESNAGEAVEEATAAAEVFLYFDVNGDIFWSSKFNKKAWLKSVKVIDTVSLSLIDEEGNEGDAVPELNEKDDLFPTDEYAEEEEVEEEEEEEIPE